MRRVMISALLAIAILAGAGIGYLLGTRATQNPITTTSSTSSQTTCTIYGQTIGVAFHLVAINYSDHSVVPVVGAGIKGEGVAYCNEEREATPIPLTATNASGWASLFLGGGGVYYLNVTYPGSGLAYSLSVPVRPVTATYVTVNISTGSVITSYCEYNINCTAG